MAWYGRNRNKKSDKPQFTQYLKELSAVVQRANARQAAYLPGARLAEPHVVQLEADDHFEDLRFFMFGVLMTA